MLLNGDCLDILPLLDAESFDSCVTDPPYGLSFMNKHWDHDVPSVEIWREVFRVLKPGAHLLAFFGTRTYHRGVCAIEDAGFEIRDQVQWLYGSGFPKSHNVSKAIDKHFGAEREVVATVKHRDIRNGHGRGVGDGLNASEREGDVQYLEHAITTPATAAAAQWEGWGTALKPAHEPIVVARKPLIGTVAENALRYGVGGLNIDGCRVGLSEGDDPRLGGKGTWGTANMAKNVYEGGYAGERVGSSELGRWPANVIHDGSDEVLEVFPDAKGQQGAVKGTEPSRTGDDGTNCYGIFKGRVPAPVRIELDKSAARFFYCAKASKADRNDGLEQFVERPSAASEFRPNHTEKAATGDDGNPYGRWKPLKNNHPTVKPTDLMRYLCRLVTPSGGHVLDPFAGSGSTGRAAVLEGFQFTGIEMDERFVEIAEARIAASEKRVLAEMYE